jgi:hypothetical protein
MEYLPVWLNAGIGIAHLTPWMRLRIIDTNGSTGLDGPPAAPKPRGARGSSHIQFSNCEPP